MAPNADQGDQLAGIPPFLRPKLRIFLSADLVGSTKLKQEARYPLSAPSPDLSVSQLAPRWLARITGFYRDVETAFRSEVRTVAEAHRRHLHRDLKALPELWKANGDELIFTAELHDATDPVYLIAAWLRALRGTVGELREPSAGGDALDIKAAAWIAGFPIGNAEIVFRQGTAEGGDETWDEESGSHHYGLLERWYADERHGLVMDYIGPSIDVGFRIASQATKGKLTLSPEIALMLSLEQAHRGVADELGFERDLLAVRYDGRRSLKGVLDDVPYPLFWLDLSPADKLAEAERQLGEPDIRMIGRFCEVFFKLHESRVLRPFMLGCSNDHIKDAPPDYMEHLRIMAAAWKRESRRLDNRDKMGNEPPATVAGTISSEQTSNILGSLDRPPAD